ncbi:hypothetical protein KAU34_05880, partial [candidate division WOR-3 bacterium]|nr:hypothetical protein [candidate division WOR-3 bacterium]
DYLMVFSDRQKMKIRNVKLFYDYDILYIERVKDGVFTVFLLPNSDEDIRLLSISVQNITSKIRDVMFRERKSGY